MIAAKNALFSSLADTSVGLELSGELSDNSLELIGGVSRELPSLEHRSSRKSFHIMPQLKVDADGVEHGQPWYFFAGGSAFDELFRMRQSMLDDLQPGAKVSVHKGTSVALVEVHGHADAFPHVGGGIVEPCSDGRIPRATKKVLHVQPAPYHQCVAFDNTHEEASRESIAKQGARLLHPASRERFADCNRVGNLAPKRFVASCLSSSARGRPTWQSPRVGGFASSLPPRREDAEGSSRDSRQKVETVQLPALQKTARTPRSGAPMAGRHPNSGLSLQGFFPANSLALR